MNRNISTIDDIDINNIYVNYNNPRHGELETEENAISWILNNGSARAEELAKDIAKTGIIFEKPLLLKQDDKYIAYDGNRRLTCLKMLNNPNYIEDDNWNNFFAKLKEQNNFNLTKISCEISEDINYVNELIGRRHAGGETGKGQLKWNPEQKERHLISIGEKKSPTFPFVFQKILKEKGYLSDNESIQHSLLNRLLSNNILRNRCGFEIKPKTNEIIYIKEKNEVLNTIKKIHQDFSDNLISLKNIWDNESKNEYLNKLHKEGFLPKNKNNKTSEDQKNKDPNISDNVGNNRKKQKSIHIININFPIDANTPEEKKLFEIWNELQNKLIIKKHSYSIAVMIRVLIELATDYIIEKEASINITNDKQLNKKIHKTSDFLKSNKLITVSEEKNIKNSTDSYINKLHSYVHHLGAHPTEQVLNSIWGEFKKYVILCLIGIKE